MGESLRSLIESSPGNDDGDGPNMEFEDNRSLDCRPFFLKVKRSTKFCFVALRKLSSRSGTRRSLYLTASLASLPAKGECLVKARDKKLFIY